MHVYRRVLRSLPGRDRRQTGVCFWRRQRNYPSWVPYKRGEYIVGTLCPVCLSTASIRQYGEISLGVCRSCGHGWQLLDSANNAVMEASDFAEWRDRYSWYFKQRADMYIADLTATIGQPPRSAIEIGCSTGESLEALASVYPGVSCSASDLSAASIRVARQRYPEFEFTVGAFPENDEPADLLMAFHVVEHVPDIASLRQQIAARINRGGLLYIRVPNFGALSRRLFRSRWPDLVPEHVHYFTWNSLVAWLRGGGEFEPLSVTTRGSSWQWMAGLKRLLTAKRGQSASANGHPQQRVLRTIVVADRLLAPLLAVEGRAGLGSELIVTARRL